MPQLLATDPFDANESNRDSERLKTLYAVNNLLRQVEADGLDIHMILPRVLQVAVDEVSGQTGSIIVTNDQNRIEHFWHMDDSGQSSPNLFLGNIVDEGIAGWVIRSREPAIIVDTTEDERWLPRPDHPTAQDPWSAICAPLLARDRAVGAITITKEGVHQFNDEDLSLLAAISNQASSSIDNARLFDESRRRAEELTTLVTATLSVSTSLEINEVLSIVTEQMSALLRISACHIGKWDAATNSLSAWTSFPEKLDPEDKAIFYPYASEVIKRRRPVQLRHKDRNLDSIQTDWIKQRGIKSILLLPLQAQASVVGMVQLIDYNENREFSNHEVALTQTLSSQAAIAIENARLYDRAKRQLQESALVNEVGAVINSTLDLHEIMHLLLGKANELLHVEAISVALVDQAADELVYEVAVGSGSAEIVGLRLPKNYGVGGWVMEHAEPALVPDTADDFRFERIGDQRTGFFTKAIICAPLVAKGYVLGTIQAINPHEGTFNDDDLQLLVKLANLASSAVANAQQYAQTVAAEARYLGLFEDSIDAIILSDDAGNIVESNRPASSLLGYSSDQFRTLNIRDLHPDQGDFLGEQTLEDIGEEAAVHTTQIITTENLPIPVEVYVKRLASNETDFLQWIYHDITQQVELEKMRDDLMAMLFHDLQSPLGNVISSLELLNHELDEKEDDLANQILSIANRSANRLRTLIKSLLDINRLEAGHPLTDQDVVSVQDIYNEAYDAIQPNLERRQIEVKLVGDELTKVFVDKDMVARVLINLLDNALKYSQDGDTLTVAAAAAADENVEISVSDQGPGIPASLRKMIFDKFYRVPGQGGRKGIGLGLAFCRLAIEAHGGQIQADEADGGGAKFVFTLPIAGAEIDGD